MESIGIEPMCWSIAVSMVIMTFLSSHVNVLILTVTSFNSEKTQYTMGMA